MPDLHKTSSYDYHLPPKLIAQHPLEERTASRLLVLDKHTGELEHKHFYDIIDYLHPGDVLVVNKSRVIPARLFGTKENGTPIEIFLLHQIDKDSWKCLAHPGKRLKKEQTITFSEALSGEISLSDEEGIRIIHFKYAGDFWQHLHEVGHIPLPPYIERKDESEDKEHYQTVYAHDKGSVAAPTAGLHFDQRLLQAVKNKGVIIADVVLHVGLGTFRPVKVEDILTHTMHSEFCQVSEETTEIINKAKLEGRRIIAVGTTTCRTLESFAQGGILHSGEKWTSIFIYPGYQFQIIDALVTNFHLPQSTLIMLVAALAGYEHVMQAYRIAVDEQYRFFSYGDAMFIQ